MKTNPKDVDLSANLDDWYNIYKFVKVESTMTVKDLDAIDLGRYFVKFASKKLENSMSYGCVVCEKYSYKKRCKKKKKKKSLILNFCKDYELNGGLCCECAFCFVCKKKFFFIEEKQIDEESIAKFPISFEIVDKKYNFYCADHHQKDFFVLPEKSVPFKYSVCTKRFENISSFSKNYYYCKTFIF